MLLDYWYIGNMYMGTTLLWRANHKGDSQANPIVNSHHVPSITWLHWSFWVLQYWKEYIFFQTAHQDRFNTISSYHSLFPNAFYVDGLVQDCANSSANALELAQFCTKRQIHRLILWHTELYFHHNSSSLGSLIWQTISNVHVINRKKVLFINLSWFI